MSIYLVGMPGVGKTTVGTLVEERLKISFLDLDAYIEKMEKRKISEIFESDGELIFRKIEEESLFELNEKNISLISTGGGIILSEKNRKILSNSQTIYLRASVPKIYEHIKGDRGNIRPLLRDKKSLENLYLERNSYYEEVSSFILDIDYLTREAVVGATIDIVKTFL